MTGAVGALTEGGGVCNVILYTNDSRFSWEAK